MENQNRHTNSAATKAKYSLLDSELNGDFKEWAKNANLHEIQKLMSTVKETGRTIDFTSNTWGHAYYPEKVGSFFLHGPGFDFRRINPGDHLLVKFSGKIYKLIVAHIRNVNDPKDMFFAWTLIVEADINSKS